ncbi:YvbH-like oligomerisation region [Seinonella peptonophila]|uniref:YvbH-like oligomerisation region n=1 Tax=Seinonella peptonophila TaxID=112248 RepID=A0A1M4V2L7_9BACL|nr:PH domain-containing protein [Seinonella peptonophila]SHE63128.1 YvbH-like oligomerisation region [Seinonella peptonophila]
MFKKVAADVLGIGDVGTVIKPEDYDKVDADDYILHEDDEKIYFLIKSKSDEYCFTNLAFVHVDGLSAASKKRTLRRYNYANNKIKNVLLETAGTVDLDVEIKFSIGQNSYSIDVHKKHLDEVKDLYKALIKIAETNHDNDALFGYAKQSLDLASNTLNRIGSENNLVDQFKDLNQFAFNWLVAARKKYVPKDLGHIFEKYINN